MKGKYGYTSDPGIKEYGPIPEGAVKFQKDLGYKPVYEILGWAWSTTFRRWGAFVWFERDGWIVFTYPEPECLSDGT